MYVPKHCIKYDNVCLSLNESDCYRYIKVLKVSVQNKSTTAFTSSFFEFHIHIDFFCRKYIPLVSMDQRQNYKDDFNAEYDEYRLLHTRVENITRRFTQLDSQCRKLVAGSKEHQVAVNALLAFHAKQTFCIFNTCCIRFPFLFVFFFFFHHFFVLMQSLNTFYAIILRKHISPA